MKICTLLAGPAMALMLMAAPAVAGADTPSHPGPPASVPNSAVTPGGNGSSSDDTPGPTASAPSKRRAYGRYCQNQSKKHVPGQRQTPFSICVTAMAKLAHGSTTNPRLACKDASKQHVAGQRGTPFSRCVSSGAQLLRDRADDPAAEGDPKSS